MSREEWVFELLDDLDAEADVAFGAQRALEVAEQARAEYGTVTLNARLMAAVGRQVRLGVRGWGTPEGRLAGLAEGWLLLGCGDRSWAVRTPAVLWCEGAPGHAVAEVAWPRTARLGFGSVLRRMADDGAPAQAVLTDGTRMTGRWQRIGADFAELVTLPGTTMLIPFAGIAAVAQVASES